MLSSSTLRPTQARLKRQLVPKVMYSARTGINGTRNVNLKQHCRSLASCRDGASVGKRVAPMLVHDTKNNNSNSSSNNRGNERAEKLGVFPAIHSIHSIANVRSFSSHNRYRWSELLPSVENVTVDTVVVPDRNNNDAIAEFSKQNNQIALIETVDSLSLSTVEQLSDTLSSTLPDPAADPAAMTVVPALNPSDSDFMKLWTDDSLKLSTFYMRDLGGYLDIPIQIEYLENILRLMRNKDIDSGQLIVSRVLGTLKNSERHQIDFIRSLLFKEPVKNRQLSTLLAEFPTAVAHRLVVELPIVWRSRIELVKLLELVEEMVYGYNSAAQQQLDSMVRTLIEDKLVSKSPKALKADVADHLYEQVFLASNVLRVMHVMNVCLDQSSQHKLTHTLHSALAYLDQTDPIIVERLLSEVVHSAMLLVQFPLSNSGVSGLSPEFGNQLIDVAHRHMIKSISSSNIAVEVIGDLLKVIFELKSAGATVQQFRDVSAPTQSLLTPLTTARQQQLVAILDEYCRQMINKNAPLLQHQKTYNIVVTLAKMNELVLPPASLVRLLGVVNAFVETVVRPAGIKSAVYVSHRASACIPNPSSFVRAVTEIIHRNSRFSQSSTHSELVLKTQINESINRLRSNLHRLIEVSVGDFETIAGINDFLRSCTNFGVTFSPELRVLPPIFNAMVSHFTLRTHIMAEDILGVLTFLRVNRIPLNNTLPLFKRHLRECASGRALDGRVSPPMQRHMSNVFMSLEHSKFDDDDGILDSLKHSIEQWNTGNSKSRIQILQEISDYLDPQKGMWGTTRGSVEPVLRDTVDFGGETALLQFGTCSDNDFITLSKHLRGNIRSSIREEFSSTSNEQNGMLIRRDDIKSTIDRFEYIFIARMLRYGEFFRGTNQNNGWVMHCMKGLLSFDKFSESSRQLLDNYLLSISKREIDIVEVKLSEETARSVDFASHSSLESTQQGRLCIIRDVLDMLESFNLSWHNVPGPARNRVIKELKEILSKADCYPEYGEIFTMTGRLLYYGLPNRAPLRFNDVAGGLIRIAHKQMRAFPPSQILGGKNVGPLTGDGYYYTSNDFYAKLRKLNVNVNQLSPEIQQFLRELIDGMCTYIMASKHIQLAATGSGGQQHFYNFFVFVEHLNELGRERFYCLLDAITVNLTKYPIVPETPIFHVERRAAAICRLLQTTYIMSKSAIPSAHSDLGIKFVDQALESSKDQSNVTPTELWKFQQDLAKMLEGFGGPAYQQFQKAMITSLVAAVPHLPIHSVASLSWHAPFMGIAMKPDSALFKAIDLAIASSSNNSTTIDATIRIFASLIVANNSLEVLSATAAASSTSALNSSLSSENIAQISIPLTLSDFSKPTQLKFAEAYRISLASSLSGDALVVQQFAQRAFSLFDSPLISRPLLKPHPTTSRCFEAEETLKPVPVPVLNVVLKQLAQWHTLDRTNKLKCLSQFGNYMDPRSSNLPSVVKDTGKAALLTVEFDNIIDILHDSSISLSFMKEGGTLAQPLIESDEEHNLMLRLYEAVALRVCFQLQNTSIAVHVPQFRRMVAALHPFLSPYSNPFAREAMAVPEIQSSIVEAFDGAFHRMMASKKKWQTLLIAYSHSLSASTLVNLTFNDWSRSSLDSIHQNTEVLLEHIESRLADIGVDGVMDNHEYNLFCNAMDVFLDLSTPSASSKWNNYILNSLIFIHGEQLQRQQLMSKLGKSVKTTSDKIFSEEQEKEFLLSLRLMPQVERLVAVGAGSNITESNLVRLSTLLDHSRMVLMTFPNALPLAAYKLIMLPEKLLTTNSSTSSPKEPHSSSKALVTQWAADSLMNYLEFSTFSLNRLLAKTTMTPHLHDPLTFHWFDIMRAIDTVVRKSTVGSAILDNSSLLTLHAGPSADLEIISRFQQSISRYVTAMLTANHDMELNRISSLLQYLKNVGVRLGGNFEGSSGSAGISSDSQHELLVGTLERALINCIADKQLFNFKDLASCLRQLESHDLLFSRFDVQIPIGEAGSLDTISHVSKSRNGSASTSIELRDLIIANTLNTPALPEEESYWLECKRLVAQLNMPKLSDFKLEQLGNLIFHWNSPIRNMNLFEYQLSVLQELLKFGNAVDGICSSSDTFIKLLASFKKPLDGVSLRDALWTSATAGDAKVFGGEYRRSLSSRTNKTAEMGPGNIGGRRKAPLVGISTSEHHLNVIIDSAIQGFEHTVTFHLQRFIKTNCQKVPAQLLPQVDQVFSVFPFQEFSSKHREAMIEVISDVLNMPTSAQSIQQIRNRDSSSQFLDDLSPTSSSSGHIPIINRINNALGIAIRVGATWGDLKETANNDCIEMVSDSIKELIASSSADSNQLLTNSSGLLLVVRNLQKMTPPPATVALSWSSNASRTENSLPHAMRVRLFNDFVVLLHHDLVKLQAARSQQPPSKSASVEEESSFERSRIAKHIAESIVKHEARWIALLLNDLQCQWSDLAADNKGKFLELFDAYLKNQQAGGLFLTDAGELSHRHVSILEAPLRMGGIEMPAVVVGRYVDFFTKVVNTYLADSRRVSNPDKGPRLQSSSYEGSMPSSRAYRQPRHWLQPRMPSIISSLMMAIEKGEYACKIATTNKMTKSKSAISKPSMDPFRAFRSAYKLKQNTKLAPIIGQLLQADLPYLEFQEMSQFLRLASLVGYSVHPDSFELKTFEESLLKTVRSYNIDFTDTASGKASDHSINQAVATVTQFFSVLQGHPVELGHVSSNITKMMIPIFQMMSNPTRASVVPFSSRFESQGALELAYQTQISKFVWKGPPVDSITLASLMQSLLMWKSLDAGEQMHAVQRIVDVFQRTRIAQAMAKQVQVASFNVTDQIWKCLLSTVGHPIQDLKMVSKNLKQNNSVMSSSAEFSINSPLNNSFNTAAEEQVNLLEDELIFNLVRTMTLSPSRLDPFVLPAQVVDDAYSHMTPALVPISTVLPFAKLNQLNRLLLLSAIDRKISELGAISAIAKRWTVMRSVVHFMQSTGVRLVDLPKKQVLSLLSTIQQNCGGELTGSVLQAKELSHMLAALTQCGYHVGFANANVHRDFGNAIISLADAQVPSDGAISNDATAASLHACQLALNDLSLLSISWSDLSPDEQLCMRRLISTTLQQYSINLRAPCTYSIADIKFLADLVTTQYPLVDEQLQTVLALCNVLLQNYFSIAELAIPDFQQQAFHAHLSQSANSVVDSFSSVASLAAAVMNQNEILDPIDSGLAPFKHSFVRFLVANKMNLSPKSAFDALRCIRDLHVPFSPTANPYLFSAFENLVILRVADEEFSSYLAQYIEELAYHGVRFQQCSQSMQSFLQQCASSAAPGTQNIISKFINGQSLLEVKDVTISAEDEIQELSTEDQALLAFNEESSLKSGLRKSSRDAFQGSAKISEASRGNSSTQVTTSIQRIIAEIDAQRPTQAELSSSKILSRLKLSHYTVQPLSVQVDILLDVYRLLKFGRRQLLNQNKLEAIVTAMLTLSQGPLKEAVMDLAKKCSQASSDSTAYCPLDIAGAPHLIHALENTFLLAIRDYIMLSAAPPSTPLTVHTSAPLISNDEIRLLQGFPHAEALFFNFSQLLPFFGLSREGRKECLKLIATTLSTSAVTPNTALSSTSIRKSRTVIKSSVTVTLEQTMKVLLFWRSMRVIWDSLSYEIQVGIIKALRTHIRQYLRNATVIINTRLAQALLLQLSALSQLSFREDPQLYTRKEIIEDVMSLLSKAGSGITNVNTGATPIRQLVIEALTRLQCRRDDLNIDNQARLRQLLLDYVMSRVDACDPNYGAYAHSDFVYLLGAAATGTVTPVESLQMLISFIHSAVSRHVARKTSVGSTATNILASDHPVIPCSRVIFSIVTILENALLETGELGDEDHVDAAVHSSNEASVENDANSTLVLVATKAPRTIPLNDIYNQAKMFRSTLKKYVLLEGRFGSITELRNTLYGLTVLSISYKADKDVFAKFNQCFLDILGKYPAGSEGSNVDHTIECIQLMREYGFAYDELSTNLKAELTKRVSSCSSEKAAQLAAALDSLMH